MADEDAKRPLSSATRGGGMPPEDWPYPHPRCIDCPQFESIGGRVDRLETRIGDVDKRLGSVERKQDSHTRDLSDLKADVGSVKRWLDGGNGKPGFRVEWALVSNSVRRGINIRERIAWGMGGLLTAGLLGLLGKVVLDAIQRGVTP